MTDFQRDLSTNQISHRLDSLPFTRKHGRLLTGSGLGWALDAMDVGLISFIIAALAEQWSLNTGETGLIASIGFVGMAIGASVGGLLADRIGRRQVFALTLLVYGIATGASALVGGLGALLILRFVVGLGLGAELPVASTYMSEFAPSRVRGRLIVLLEAFWAVGWTAAAIIGYFVVPASANGWRWAFVIGAIPAVYAMFVRWGMPESPRWLARQGRAAEAEQIVASFEASPVLGGGVFARYFRSVPRQTTLQHTSPQHTATQQPASQPSLAPTQATPTAPQQLPEQVPTQAIKPTPAGRALSKNRLSALWGAEFRGRTTALWVVWLTVNFAYYGAFIWIPSILVENGFSLVRSFGFTLIITLAQLPGYAVAAWLIEVLGRKITLSAFLCGSAAAAIAFGNAETEGAIIASGMALSFFNLGAWGALYAVTPELYPTSLRATGAGWAAGTGRIASIVAPLMVPVLLVSGGTQLTFAVFAACFVIAAVATWGLRDHSGEALDDR